MTAHELVAKVKNLPPISQAALQLVNLLDEPAVSNEDVVQVLKYDNVLTAKLLRACNSPYFGLEEPVSSVDQAVLILGHHQILHIVLTLAFGGAMAVPLTGYAVESNELWRHSLTAATAAEHLAVNGIDMNADPHVAFTVGLLHDIGKLAIPDHILFKPGKLTSEEWEIMQKHPEFAYEMLSPIRYLKPALPIPYFHHEKWDGSGYPLGLRGEQIPLEARVFAVIDVWDALLSDRPYRKAWTVERTLEHIGSLAGSHFDPEAVECFLAVIKTER